MKQMWLLIFANLIFEMYRKVLNTQNGTLKNRTLKNVDPLLINHPVGSSYQSSPRLRLPLIPLKKKEIAKVDPL